MVERARQIDEHLAAVRVLLDEQVAAGRSWYDAQGRRPQNIWQDYATSGAIARDANQALRFHLGQWLEADSNVGMALSMLSKTDR